MNAVSSFFAVLTLLSGAVLTLRTGFFQFTHLHRSLAVVFGKGRSEKRNKEARKGPALSPFQAMASALGGSVGTANIAGTAGAIALGGPGAVFWMWIAGLLGMGVKFTEIVLALLYREKRNGEYVGGPMLYIEKGLGKRRGFALFARPVARLFALFGLLAGSLSTPLVQSNTVGESAELMLASLFPEAEPSFFRPAAALFCAVLVGAAVLGGVKRIGRISGYTVPFMALAYAAACCAVLFVFRRNLGMALGSIVRGAFGLRPAAGGLFGYGMLRTMRVGIARGVYSNEAGVGSAPIAHAAAETTDPVKQGMYGIFEVFADTLVICTLTAVSVLASGAFTAKGGGTAIALAAFSPVFGKKASAVFLAFSLLLFAYTSIIGWSVYALRCGEHLFGKKAKLPCCAVITLCSALGAFIPAARVWQFGEILNYLMAAPNLIALLLLSGEAAREVRAFRCTEAKKPRLRKAFSKLNF